MATFTRTDGATLNIPGNTVKRIRRTVNGEDSVANTRIDAAVTSYVLESVGEVAQSVQNENTNFTHLNSKDGSAIWFDATKAMGPLEITEQMRSYGYNSSINLMNYRQHVVQTHEEVITILSDAGGSPLPVPTG